MTVALPAVVDVEFYRGDGGAPNAEIDFEHDFTWGNVTEAKFYVRKAPGGDLLVAIAKTLHPSRWVDNGNGTAYVRLMASDTDGKPDGLWWYDIELTSSQRTQTVQRGRFHLLGDIAGNAGSIITLPGLYAVPGNVYDALVNAQGPSFGNVFITQSALTAQLAPLLAGGTYFGQNVWAEVRVATTGNLTLSGLQTVDGISLGANDRVLVKNQTAATANGIYVAASGAWARASDADEAGEFVAGKYVFVQAGTANANKGFVLANTGAINLGSTALTFAQFNGGTGGSQQFSNLAVGTVGAASAIRLLINTPLDRTVAGIKIRGGGASGDGFGYAAGNQNALSVTHENHDPPGGTGLYDGASFYTSYWGNLGNAAGTLEGVQIVTALHGVTVAPNQHIHGMEVAAGPGGGGMSGIVWPAITGIYGDVNCPDASGGTITTAASVKAVFPSMSSAGGNAIGTAIGVYSSAGMSVTPSVAPTYAYGLYADEPAVGANRWAAMFTGKVEIRKPGYAGIKLIPQASYFSWQARADGDGAFEVMSILAEDLVIETGLTATVERVRINDAGLKLSFDGSQSMQMAVSSAGHLTMTPTGTNVVFDHATNAQFQVKLADPAYLVLAARTTNDGAYVDTIYRASAFVVELGTGGATTERFRVADTYANLTTRLQYAVPVSAPADVVLGNGQVVAWVDEGGSKLMFKVKLSGGTVKSGEVGLS